MRYRLRGIFTYRLKGPRKGGEHPAYTPVRVWYAIFFTLDAFLSEWHLHDVHLPTGNEHRSLWDVFNGNVAVFNVYNNVIVTSS